MKKLFYFLLVWGFTSTVVGQLPVAYREHVAKADSLIGLQKYAEASVEFQKAFDANEGKAIRWDRYNAACAYALSDNNEQAFYHLFYLAEHPNIRFQDYGHLSSDPDLKPLHSLERWEELLQLVKANKEEFEKDFDHDLIAKLAVIREEDQKYRREINEIEETYGRESEEVKAHWKLIEEKDSINLIAVKKILDERGWLGANVIGGSGNTTLFLVIQHADLATQEYYLPMMKEAVNQGSANGSSLALLEDRIALRKGQKQIYGSQIGYDKENAEYYVLPLIDPEHVDDRRKEVGLGLLENYASRWRVVWDVEAYKVKLPRYEKMQIEE